MSETTTTNPSLICVADLRPDPAAERSREASFRRGFTQGFCAGLDAAAIYPVDVCNAHANALLEWRYHNDPGHSFCPPMVGDVPTVTRPEPAEVGDGDDDVEGGAA
jgi:hypothetical protein